MKPIPLDDRLPGLVDPESLRSWRLTKAAIFASIAIAAVVWLVVDQRKVASQRALMTSGASARAKVTDLETFRGGQLLLISYSFPVDGRTIDVHQRKVGSFEGLHPGDAVTVRYDPADPTNCVLPNELTTARFGWTPWLYAVLIVVMMALAGFQAYRVIRPKGDSGLGE